MHAAAVVALVVLTLAPTVPAALPAALPSPAPLPSGPFEVFIASEPPFDPRWSAQWGAEWLRLPEAWESRTGGDLVVAVLDTGVDAAHPDLEGRVLPGWDAITRQPGADDWHGHGTWVAGILAAGIGNGLAIAGGAEVQVLPVRVLNAAGAGMWGDVAAGVRWATEQGADIVTMSLSGNAYNASLQAAVREAEGKGVLLVAAAGNSGYLGFPARYPEVVAVGGVDEGGSVTFDYNDFPLRVETRGPARNVAGLAPGGSITLNDGTSAAAPFASAIAALTWLEHPAWDPWQVRQALRPRLDAPTALEWTPEALPPPKASFAAGGTVSPDEVPLLELPARGTWTLEHCAGAGPEPLLRGCTYKVVDLDQADHVALPDDPLRLPLAGAPALTPGPHEVTVLGPDRLPWRLQFIVASA